MSRAGGRGFPTKKRKVETWLRLEDDGARAVVAFLGDPHVRDVHWIAKRSERCPGSALCTHCAMGAKPKRRFCLNAYVLAVDATQAWETNAVTFESLIRIHHGGGFERTLFTILRKGAKGEVKTTYEVTPAEPITNDLRKTLGRVRLHDLDELLGDAAQGFPSQTVEELLPREPTIDLTTAVHFIARLRDLTWSYDRASEFLAHFGLRRVVELPLSAALTADAWLSDRERLDSEKPDGPDEIDPFS
jgi:hypothetical protein